MKIFGLFLDYEVPWGYSKCGIKGLFCIFSNYAKTIMHVITNIYADIYKVQTV